MPYSTLFTDPRSDNRSSAPAAPTRIATAPMEEEAAQHAVAACLRVCRPCRSSATVCGTAGLILERVEEEAWQRHHANLYMYRMLMPRCSVRRIDRAEPEEEQQQQEGAEEEQEQQEVEEESESELELEAAVTRHVARHNAASSVHSHSVAPYTLWSKSPPLSRPR